MKPYILEACVDSADSARIACEAGADRLEPVSYTHLDVYKRQPVC